MSVALPGNRFMNRVDAKAALRYRNEGMDFEILVADLWSNRALDTGFETGRLDFSAGKKLTDLRRFSLAFSGPSTWSG